MGCGASKAPPQGDAPTGKEEDHLRVGDITYVKERQVGDGIWASVILCHPAFTAKGKSKEKAALKVLNSKQDTETQCVEMALEVRLNTFAYELAASAAKGTCARVPRTLASSAGVAAFEYVGGGVTLESYLRGDYKTTQRPLDAAAMAPIKALCCIAARKVAALLQLGVASEFSHRDLNDGNVMIRVKKEPIATADDVDVWLIDFGKSMARIGGEEVSAGIFKDPSLPLDQRTRIFEYNPTTDVVRLLMNMQQSLIRAHSGKKNEAPTGAVRDFLLEHMPFNERMDAFIKHIKEVAAADDTWSADEKAAPPADLDFLSFAAKPSFHMLRKYYVLPEEKWCKEVMPNQLISD